MGRNISQTNKMVSELEHWSASWIVLPALLSLLGGIGCIGDRFGSEARGLALDLAEATGTRCGSSYFEHLDNGNVTQEFSGTPTVSTQEIPIDAVAKANGIQWSAILTVTYPMARMLRVPCDVSGCSGPASPLQSWYGPAGGGMVRLEMRNDTWWIGEVTVTDEIRNRKAHVQKYFRSFDCSWSPSGSPGSPTS